MGMCWSVNAWLVNGMQGVMPRWIGRSL